MSRAVTEADRQLAALDDADRLALVRGERLPSRQKRYRRLIRGVSQEADGLFTLLERAGGERSIRSIVRDTNLGAYVSAAAAELTDLGLAERTGDGHGAVVRLLPAANGVALVASWSMRS